MIDREPDPLRRIPIKHADVRAETGAILRAARLKRGQSLENVAEQTRIPKRFLDALENDRLDEFPAFVYMRGFMKNYCDHLDLPFDDIWTRVQASMAASAGGAPAPAAPNGAATAPPPPPPPPPSLAGPRPARALERKAGPSAAGAMLLALALGVGVAVLILHRAPAPPPPAPTAAERAPSALLPLARPVETRVVVRAIDDCWTRVTVDGTPVFEGRIPRGALMDWTPKKSLVLHATTPAALLVTVNGAPHPLGAPSPDGDYRIDVR